MKPVGTLILCRSDVCSLLRFEEYVQVIEEAFRLYAKGKVLNSGLMHIDLIDGEFHIKAGGLELSDLFFCVKVNGAFFGNMERFGMPNIQGSILLYDGKSGYPLAVMESGEITMKRTGAAAAVAAKYLARPESSVVTICGAGRQGHVQLSAMKSVLPIKNAYVFDLDKARAESFANEMSQQCSIDVVATSDLSNAVRKSDVCVTCTPSHQYYLTKEDISAGTFIAAMGADSPEKQELDPDLLKSNKVVVDVLEQCARVGELHHALERGMTRADVYAELGEIVAGNKLGRTSEEEITVFDATGTALQDAAAAVAIYQKAILSGNGQLFDFLQ